MENELLSPHMAWQEVKKIQRFMDALAKTEEVLKVLADYDNIKRRLDQEVPSVEASLKEKMDKLAQADADLSKVKQAYAKVQQDILDAHKQSEQTLEGMKTRTGQQLEQMKNSAKAQVEQERQALMQLQPAVNALKKEKLELEQAIEGLKKQAAAQVNSLVGAFKNLGS